MGKPRQLKSAKSIRLATIICLAIVICVSAVVPAHAQKKPPILTDSKLSAFNAGEVTRLQGIADNVSNPGNAKLARNKLIAIGVEQVDAAFNEHRTKTRKRTDRLNFLFDFLEIGASSAISIVSGGLRAKSLIGESLSLFQGTRSAFNKDFKFLEKQLLFDKMVALRADKLTEIYKKLDKEVLEYPWEQARSEVRDYFFAGTIDEALSGLSRDTGAQAVSAEAALKEAKKAAGIVGPVSEEQKSAHKAFEAVIKPIIDKNAEASSRLKKATDDIAAAQKQIDDENAKEPAQRVQATIDAANATKTAAETARDKANADQAKWLEKMKSVFDKIVDNPILTPLLPTISTGKGIQPAQKEKIEESLKKAREGNGTFDDYSRVLGNLRRVVVNMINTDPAPNDELQKLLVANE